MIKFTIVFVIVYLVLMAITKIYVSGLDAVDQYLIAFKKFSKGQSIWFAILGIMRLLSIIFGAISVIMLVVEYL